MGFTRKAYERLHEILPAVLRQIRACDCEDGCPCCVGKPLRKFDTWNVERGEGSVPCKESARRILEGLMPTGARLDCPDTSSTTDREEADRQRLRRALRRRLERGREPKVFHPIDPDVETEYPEPEKEEDLDRPDRGTRRRRQREFHRELDRRLARKIPEERLSPTSGKPGAPQKMKRGRGDRSASHFPGRPAVQEVQNAPEAPRKPKPQERETSAEPKQPESQETIVGGDSLAARARRRRKKKDGEGKDS
jgi:hypothetical protein